MESRDYIISNQVQLRNLEGESPNSRIVCGYALKFNSESQNMGYIEVIRPGAITEDTIMNSDIYATFNHNEEKVLARSRYGEGSLALELREDGLYYEFEAPNTVLGDELLEHLKRGEITTSSFAFTLPTDGSGDKWTKREDGTLFREILKIDRLYDVAPVYEPAYLATTCSKRAKEMIDASAEINKKYDAILGELKEFII